MGFLSLYRLVTGFSAPFLRAHLYLRAGTGKEDATRLHERRGIASSPSFETRPLWIHGASVGEAMAALIVIEEVRKIIPNLPVLLTTGTRTSANVVPPRLPPNAVHQYAPLDHPDWVGRFLDYWRPCAALRLESELWPNTLLALKNRNIPAALLNARMSARSFRRWSVARKGIRALLSSFDAILAESEDSARHYRTLGGMHVDTLPNLKFAAAPLPVDPQKFAAIQESIGPRSLWLYASTHGGEETLAAHLHTELKKDFPSLLTIIVPRHPARRDAILADIAPFGLKVACRTSTPAPAPDTDIFIADTMGEMGLFFTLAPVAVIGRSFSTDGGGGHNPIEAVQMDCFPLHGPNVQNLQAIHDEMDAAHAAERCDNETALLNALHRYLSNPALLRDRRNHAHRFVLSRQAEVRGHLASFLASFLDKRIVA